MRRYGRYEDPATRRGADYDAEWTDRLPQNPEIDLRMGRLLCRGTGATAHLLEKSCICFMPRASATRVGAGVSWPRESPTRLHWRDGRNKKHFQKLLDVAIEQLWLASGDR